MSGFETVAQIETLGRELSSEQSAEGGEEESRSRVFERPIGVDCANGSAMAIECS